LPEDAQDDAAAVGIGEAPADARPAIARAAALTKPGEWRIQPAAAGSIPANGIFFCGGIMYAVIRTGGKQHRVSADDRLVVERLAGAPGDPVVFDDILMLAGGDDPPLVGRAMPKAARVFAEVVEQTRAPKILVFKKKRRKNHRRLNGHRQELTVVRIRGVSASGEAPGEEAPATAATTPPTPQTTPQTIPPAPQETAAAEDSED
jgi:large subunit ribosomal protein L21